MVGLGVKGRPADMYMYANKYLRIRYRWIKNPSSGFDVTGSLPHDYSN